MSHYSVDVAIVGGGLSGCVAAIAARRTGAKVLLIEKNPFPGGMATAARVHSMLTFHGKQGHKIIGGIPQEIIDNLKKSGGTCGHILDTVGVAYSVTPTDPDRLALILQAMLEENGVHCLFDARFLEPVMEDKSMREIRGIHAGGYFTAGASIFIDASGEGSLAASAGCLFDSGKDGNVMPATLIFQVRGVDFAPIFDYMEKNPGEFHHETRFANLRNSPAPGISGFFSIWRNAELSIPRDRLLLYKTLQEDEVAINSTRVADFEPLNPRSFAKACRIARQQVYMIYDFLKKKVPGFENCKISNIATFIGVREVRRIRGIYTLTGEDLVKGRRFEDEIALGGFPIDIHDPKGAGLETGELGGRSFYGIPYRCLLTSYVENLLITGKCFSAKFEAHASARVQATVMAMGQAAGAAAAICVKKKISPVELSPLILRQSIIDEGGILEPEGKDDLP